MTKSFFSGFTKWFKTDLIIKIASVVLALIFWIYIVKIYDPNTVTLLDNLPVTINLEESAPTKASLILVSEEEQFLNIEVQGPREAFATFNREKIKLSVDPFDLSQIDKPGEYTLRVNIDFGGQNIRVINNRVYNIKLIFETAAKKSILVRVEVKGNGRAEEGYFIDQYTIMPKQLELFGPEQVIKTIDYALVQVELNDAVITQTKIFKNDYKLYTVDGLVVENKKVTTNYEQIDVTFPVLKQKTVSLVFEVINSSGGFESLFINKVITPSTITVAGSSDIIDNLNQITLEPVDVVDVQNSLRRSLQILLPNGVKCLSGETSAQIDVEFPNSVTRYITTGDIELTNVGEGVTAQATTKGLSILVRGISSDLEKLNRDNVKLTVDLKGQSVKGSYKLPVYAIFPDGTKVGVIGKYEAWVRIS